MTHKVLRSFPFSRDGIKIETAEAGGDVDLPEALVSGLEAAGFIGDPDAQPSQPAGAGADPNGGQPAGKPAIPADWRDLHHVKMIPLAKQFDENVSTKAQAIAALEAAEKAAAEAPQA